MPDSEIVKQNENAAHTDVTATENFIVVDIKKFVAEVEAWIHRHFNHLTPNTTDHNIVLNAAIGLNTTVLPNSAVATTVPPSVVASAPAAETPAVAAVASTESHA